MAAIKVLIVDDVSKVRQDLRTVLTLVGNADKAHPIEIVGEAADGLNAIHQVEYLQPDVILMDLEMPSLDGYEATQQIKVRFPACRVIALTVHDYEEARLKALQARMEDFIVKGASIETLVKAIIGIKN